MKTKSSNIPVHKLKDRQSSGIFLRHVNNDEGVRNEHIMRAHRDDHYIFLIQKTGSSLFMVDFKETVIEKPAIYCVLPGQVHYFKASDNVSGWFLALDTALVEEQYRRVFEEEMDSLFPLCLNDNRILRIEQCFRSLEQALNSGSSGIHQSIVAHLTGACVGLIAEAYLQHEEKSNLSNNRTTTITRAFRSLVRQEYKRMKAPSDYAAALNLSLSYLNECVKTTTGSPVSLCIQQEIIMEAKRLLYYSSLTVKEIAHELGFEDHTYLSRLFLKATGTTPGQFRKTYHE